MGMLLHGIFASSALDSTSEILDIKGLDVSSLAVANYEHESKIPGQVCGKVLKSVKIFKPEDCENPEQLMFWNRIKIPFLYGVIELFDDVGHSGALDVAAMALYDQNNKDKYDFKKTFPLIGFSIEGSKINKEQNVITHSLARKVSLTITPANKTCWGEIYQETQNQKPAAINKRDSIAKAKDILSKILKSEQISAEQQVLIKHDIQDLENLEKNELEKAVHFPTTMPGVSDMGIEARRGDIKKPGVVAHGYGRVTKPEIHLGRAKAIAQKQLESIRQEPKPSLPKSEELVGGKGDNKSLSSFNNKQVKMGRTVEMEHTKSPKIAQEITADHLTEDPDYYSKLKDAGLADELEKGLRGNWQKEGYKISHKPTKKGLTVQAHNKNGDLVGEVDFVHHNEKSIYPNHTEVESNHQRKGLATEMYHHAMRVTGKKIKRPGYYDQTPEAKSLWDNNPHRGLVKSESPLWSSRRAAIPIKKEEKPRPQWSSRRAVNSMQKALTATASPLNPEILEPKMQTVTKSLDLKKSEAVDAAIPTWNLVEKFKDFLKERVPSLTDKEAGAFTRAFKIFKIKAAENKLKDL